MAVAVKSPPIAPTSSLLDRTPVVSLVGAAYVLVSLGIAFWAVPALWNLAGLSAAVQSVLDYWGQGSALVIGLILLAGAAGIGWAAYQVHRTAEAQKKEGGPGASHELLRTGLIGLAVLVAVGGLLVSQPDLLLVAAEFAVLIALAYVGVRLLGPNQPAGARAGIFLAAAGFVVILLLTRWASLWLEYGIYAGHASWLGDSPKVGLALTAAVAAVLLGLEGYLFFRPRTEKFLGQVEGQGWFSATSYKGQQGQRVRRATILGLLLIAGSGVYTMWNNGLLRRLPDSLGLNVPFTGMVAVQDLGDLGPYLRKLDPKDRPPLDQVQLVLTKVVGGKEITETRNISAQDYRNRLKARIDGSPDLDPQTKDRLKQEVDGKDITEILNISGLNVSGTSAPLAAAVGPTALLTLPPPEPGLRSAVLRLDQYTLRDLNDRLQREYVRVTNPGLSDLKRGSVIPAPEFNKEKDSPQYAGDEKPTATAPLPAVGPVESQRLTLLPALQYTLPLLLIAASIWLAWRVVNYPPFGDFLIATEAELNKVSWTTRPRLIQDTIVVLVTTFLLAIFLFLMDQTWRVVLSWKPVGVLQISDDKSDQSAEQKKW